VSRLLALLPLLALLGLGALAWRRGMVSGLWLAPWECVVAALALLLSFLRPPAGRAAGRSMRAARRRR
jgi:hypothetical protein